MLLNSQSLVFQSAIPTTEEIKLPKHTSFTDLNYKEILVDATHGQPPSNKTVVVQEVRIFIKIYLPWWCWD